jgi:hypothetical protein
VCSVPVVLVDHDEDDLGLHERQILADAVPRTLTERRVSVRSDNTR